MNAPSREELDEKTVEELQKDARKADIEGRSDMNKEELVDALADDSPSGDDVGPGRHQVRPASAGPENERTAPIAGPPPAADQPGIGRAANPEPKPEVDGPVATRPVSRVGEAIERKREQREASVKG